MRNASKYISQTIESVMAQSFTSWELIVVDDASTDGGKCKNIVNEYSKKDSRIKLLCLQKNKGSSGARNEGLKIVQGRYLSFLDSDDIWHTDYLSTMYNHIQQNTIPKVAVYYCGYRRMDDDCKKSILPDYKDPGVKTVKKLLHHCPIFPSISIFDTSCLKEKVFFREELHSLRDDYVYVLDILMQGFVALGFEDILVDYRMRSDSITASKKKMITPQWNVYRKVYHLNFFTSCIYLFSWAVNGLKKYHR
ncbi:MAG: glycosyltransferase family 2 protein [Treponema sp.]|nr:glycosyltransferase family 2 protein [Treponema sp.]